jgi:hydrogenase-4 component B
MITFFQSYGLFMTLGIYAMGAALSLLFSAKSNEESSWTLAHLIAALGGIVGLTYALMTIFTGGTLDAHFVNSLGIGTDILTLHIDGLAAFFIAVISTIAIAASVFGTRYFEHYAGIYRLGSFGFFYNVFIASMILVVSANNALLFLLAWEMMAISSYFLVIFEHEEETNINAGTFYILISQLGAACLFAAFLLLYKFTGSWDFDLIRVSSVAIPVAMQNAILAFALIGLASKAGVIPLHIWLPEAHPAAPSHVSALMSGVMLKVAIYMIIRFFFDLFSSVDPMWGLIIIVFGSISALIGILYALSENDIKRVLAFSSVENIGIILFGLGAAVTFFSLHLTALGVVALVAALYHTVNHALFKSLLFLAAGSVVHATHTRNMEAYGGLAKVMPWTSVFFLMGAVAISGLPPFNGFVSEWFTFQSLFLGIATLPVFEKIIFLLGASSLAFTGGLAAACFVKAFGMTFLARPRSQAYELAHESGYMMQGGMAMLAALTIVFSVAAGAITPALANIVASLRGGSTSGTGIMNPFQPIALGHFSSLSMLLIAVALCTATLAIFIFSRFMSRNQKVVISRTWDCGYPLTPRMEISSAGFSRSLIMIFRGLLRPTMQTDVEYHDATSRYFTKTKAVRHTLPDIYYGYIYEPVVRLLEHGAHEARRIQTGNLNTYLLYMFLTLLILLFWTLK